MRRRRSAGVALALACGGACGGSPPEVPVELRRDAGDGSASSFAVEYEQDIRWGTAALERRYGARYTLRGRGDGRAMVRLDSLGATVSTPHGRQVFDARHLWGSEFELPISAGGGIPDYPEAEPVLDMGPVLERELRLSRLMNYGFPELPDRPVKPGDRWSRRSARPQVEALIHTLADVTTEYLFAGWETVDGVACAEIEGRVTAEMAGELGDPAEGPRYSYTGTLSGIATWLLDPASGRLMGMSGHESSEGRLVRGDEETSIVQDTRVRIVRGGAS